VQKYIYVQNPKPKKFYDIQTHTNIITMQNIKQICSQVDSILHKLLHKRT